MTVEMQKRGDLERSATFTSVVCDNKKIKHRLQLNKSFGFFSALHRIFFVLLLQILNNYPYEYVMILVTDCC